MAAKAYYAQNGNLSVPIRYVTPDGIRLGEWVYRQKQHWKPFSFHLATP